ncbi:hypothetical protein AMD24_00820 [Candidatus Xiphinematobacter sp. Idaho Grape]|nr:hypothetical protein AMD24_00820 [Candidatus Xiphinematobacter sp. Idaho Grape]
MADWGEWEERVAKVRLTVTVAIIPYFWHKIETVPCLTELSGHPMHTTGIVM